MTEKSPRVDAFLAAPGPWRPEFGALRTIALASGLAETFKWGWPCYTQDGRNVVLIHGFKDYCALLFPKGALLADPEKILVQQTENVQAARQIRFTSLGQIVAMKDALAAYIRAAAEAEASGAKAPMKATEDFSVPEEFRVRLDADAALKAGFEALTPGRKRAWLLHFSGAKQAKTRAARVEAAVARILDGKGPDD